MYITVDGKDYWIQSDGEGFPIVLLHGFTGSSKTWEHFIDKWKHSYRVITIDLPGHGNTQLDHVVRMEEVCDDLNKILTRLHINQAHLLGYSMGGRTALSFSMMYPDKVGKLILESGSPGLAESHQQIARQAQDEALAQRIEQQGVLSFVNYWEKIPLFDSQKNVSDSTQKKLRQERLNQTVKGLAASLRGMGTGVQPSWWEKLPSMSIDVSIIVGELDSKFIDIGRQMNDIIKTSELKIVANAGHAIHLEQPQQFDYIVTRFINNQ